MVTVRIFCPLSSHRTLENQQFYKTRPVLLMDYKRYTKDETYIIQQQTVAVIISVRCNLMKKHKFSPMIDQKMSKRGK